MENVTSLFKDIATAVDENEKFVAGIFGSEAAVEAILGLQQVLHVANIQPFLCAPSALVSQKLIVICVGPSIKIRIGRIE